MSDELKTIEEIETRINGIHESLTNKYQVEEIGNDLVKFMESLPKKDMNAIQYAKDDIEKFMFAIGIYERKQSAKKEIRRVYGDIERQLRIRAHVVKTLFLK